MFSRGSETVQVRSLYCVSSLWIRSNRSKVDVLYRRLNIRRPMECRQKEISDCLRNGSVLVVNEKDKRMERQSTRHGHTQCIAKCK